MDAFISGLFYFCFTLFLLRSSGIGRTHIFLFSVFGFACVFLFSMSGVYHFLAAGSIARHVLRILDHAGIYVLIAGSFTAIHGVLFRGFMRWGIILIVWILAINGITLGTIFFDSMPESLSLIFLLSFGWPAALRPGAQVTTSMAMQDQCALPMALADSRSLGMTFWSIGHRNLLGIAFDRQGRLWTHEIGPRHGDST